MVCCKMCRGGCVCEVDLENVMKRFVCVEIDLYIKSGFVFVVCVLRTIFGKKKSAHVHLEGWKHGNGDTGLNMVCTQ